MLGSRAAVVLGLVVTLASPSLADAKRDRPTQITPAKKKPRRGWPGPDIDTSEGGQKQGALEITLGSLVLGLGAALIGRGIWEIPRAKKLDDACATGTSDDVACQTAHPGRTGRISAGLSFGVAVPIGIAGGLLLARGIRIRRDHRKWHAAHGVALRPLVSPTLGGLAIGGRF